MQFPERLEDTPFTFFETCFMEGKTTYFTGFYTHTISGPKIPKPPIVTPWKDPAGSLNRMSIKGLYPWDIIDGPHSMFKIADEIY